MFSILHFIQINATATLNFNQLTELSYNYNYFDSFLKVHIHKAQL